MRLNGGIVGVNNQPNSQSATGLFSAAERALNVLYNLFPKFSNTFTFENLINRQPQPTLQSLSVTTQETSPQGLFLKPDGTKVYIVGPASDNVRQYSLSTPWDLSTGTYDNVTFSVLSQSANSAGLFFSDDGTKFYVIDGTSRNVYQYNMSTAWNISTATYSNNSFNAAQDTAPKDLYIDSSGTILIVAGNTNDAIYKYTLSTAWDISTATYSNQFFGVVSQSSTPTGVFAKPDGKTIYVASQTPTAGVFQYTLATAWDLSTASYSGFYIKGSQFTLIDALYISPDGTKLFWTDNTAPDAVRSYSIPDAWVCDGNVGLIDSISISAVESLPSAFQFNSDGTLMYTYGQSGDQIRQWELSTPWLVSTATVTSKSFATGGQEINGHDVFFRSDGLKVYLVGITSDTVFQYTLATAWDISTASYDSVSKSVAAQTGSPYGLFFDPTGTQMYVSGAGGVFQYVLSTAWNVSTATFDKQFNVSGSTNPSMSTPTSIFMTSDGGKMFLLDNSVDFIFEYALATPWDISTAYWLNNLRFYIWQFEEIGQHVTFKDDGTQFYIVGSNSKIIYQFNVNP